MADPTRITVTFDPAPITAVSVTMVSTPVIAAVDVNLLPMGPTGPQGPTGATGATGATGPAGAGASQFYVLAADTATRSSTTTYADEAGFALPTLEPNKAYRIEWSIPVSAGAGGVKMQMKVPSLEAGNSFAVGYYFSGSSATGISLGGSSPRTFAMGFRASNDVVVSGFVIIHTGATGGAPVMQWAQNYSSTDPTGLLAGGVIAITPMFNPA